MNTLLNGTLSDSVMEKKAIAPVRKGELIIFPTDTVYGIGCDPHYCFTRATPQRIA